MDYALAWQAEHRTRCSGCGQPRDESMAKNAQYTAHAVRCHACAEAQRARDEFSKGPGSDMSGMAFYTTHEAPKGGSQ